MAFGRFAWLAVLACGAAAAYGIYAPEAADRWVPAASGLAHQLHDRIWTPPVRTPRRRRRDRDNPRGRWAPRRSS